MEINIRLATPADYPAIVAVGRKATKDYVQSVADLEFGDQTRPAGVVARKLIAETSDNQLVGVATYAQSAPTDDPKRFNVWFFVVPSLQGHGIGRRLYEQVMTELTPHQPRCLETGVRTDLPRAVRFLEARSFIEVMRECEMHLNLATFDATRFQDDLTHVTCQGITLRTLAELSDDPDRDVKLYKMAQRRRETKMEEGELPPFNKWQAHFWQIPRLLSAGFCVAIDGEQYIGQSNALASGIATEIEYGYTGVLPDYRNRRIARAMKAYVLQWAQAQGYRVVRSFSDSRNLAMLRVNQHLGFAVEPPVLWMQKSIADQEAIQV